MENPERPTLTRENAEACLDYLSSTEGVKLGLGVRWQIPLRTLLQSLERGGPTPEDEQTFIRIQHEMAQEKELLRFRNNLVESQISVGYAEVHTLQQKLPEMTAEEIQRRLQSVQGKLHEANAELERSIDAAERDFFEGKPVESFDTVGALQLAHLDFLQQILMRALKTRGQQGPGNAGTSN